MTDKSYKGELAKCLSLSKMTDTSYKGELAKCLSLSKMTDTSYKGELANRERGSWVVEMQALLDNPDNGRSQEEMKTSIYEVPPLISKINEKAYQPRVVSFGPFHNGKPQLASMEADKARALVRQIRGARRPKSGNLTMQEVFDFVAEVAEELKDAYDSLEPKWQNDTNEFVKLMILDGCFMLELLQWIHHSDNDPTHHSHNDPVFSSHGMLHVWHFIRADMLMLENQLPMLLLLRLKHILEGDEPDIEDLNEKIICLLGHDSSYHSKMGKCLHVLDLYRKSRIHRDNKDGNAALQPPDQGASQCPDQREGDYSKMGKCLHVLDLYHKGPLHTHNEDGNAAPQSANQGEGDCTKMYKCCLHKLDLHCKCLLHIHKKPGRAAPQCSYRGDGTNKGVGHNVVRPATELREAGVRFIKSESESLQDITFHDGILKLPNFTIDDFTELIFLNLIAFERRHIPANNDITSFDTFMDCMIDDSRDIKLLSSKGIIDSHVGTDKEAADLFNTISKGLVLDLNGNLGEVYANLINYCNTRCPKWRANLTHTYFRSPWAIISVIAAFILFSLTAVQTIFTILN